MFFHANFTDKTDVRKESVGRKFRNRMRSKSTHGRGYVLHEDRNQENKGKTYPRKKISPPAWTKILKIGSVQIPIFHRSGGFEDRGRISTGAAPPIRRTLHEKYVTPKVATTGCRQQRYEWLGLAGGRQIHPAFLHYGIWCIGDQHTMTSHISHHYRSPNLA